MTNDKENGKLLCVTTPLWWESIDDQWFSPQRGPCAYFLEYTVNDIEESADYICSSFFYPRLNICQFWMPFVRVSNVFCCRGQWGCSHKDAGIAGWLYLCCCDLLRYRQKSNIRRTKYQILNVSRLVLQLSLRNLLKSDFKSGIKMHLVNSVDRRSSKCIWVFKNLITY